MVLFTVMVIAFLLGLLGIIFGSFVNALVWRTHEQSVIASNVDVHKGKESKAKGEKTLTAAELSIVRGRSMCPECHHTLAAKDLVPVLSWLWLRGKCRYCGAKIQDSPLVELVTGALFVTSYVAWPYDFHGVALLQFVFWLAFLIGFVALAVYDLRWFLLPDKLVLPLTGLAVLQVIIVAVWQHSLSSLWMPAFGAAIIFGLFWLLYQVSRGAWIGGGDVKLAIILGLLAGTPLRALAVIFFASLIGTIVSIPQLMKGRQGLTQRIPFGPSLLLATVIAVLWGARIGSWYQSLVIR
jgi:leader peptidase (prepilin peptidase)/N-methyltransferase